MSVGRIGMGYIGAYTIITLLLTDLPPFTPGSNSAHPIRPHGEYNSNYFIHDS